MTANSSFDPSQAIGYYRVSTQRQEQEGHSPERYLERLEAVGIAPTDIYSDAESGGIFERKDLQKALARLKDPNKKYFVVPYHSRGHRDIGVWVKIRDALLENDCELIELDKGIKPIDLTSAAGNLQANLDATFAQHQRDQAREHSVKGHAFRRSQNRIVNPPFGYKKDSDQRLVINDDIFPGSDGKTYREIAIEMIDTLIELGGYRATIRAMCGRYSEKHPERWGVAKNFPVSTKGFMRWVQSPVIRGYLVDFPGKPNELVRKGDHEAIMDPDRWRAVQVTVENIASAPNPMNNGFPRSRKPLAGKIKCGLCGGRHNNSTVHRQGKTYSYLVCRGGAESTINSRVKRQCPYKNSIKTDQFFKEVISQVCARALDIAQEFAEPNTEVNPEIIKLRNQIQQLQAMTDPELSDVIQIKQQQLSKLEQATGQDVDPNDVDIYETVAADPEFWEELAPSELRIILDSLVKQVVVHGKQLSPQQRVKVQFYR